MSGSKVTSNPDGLLGVLKLAAKMQPDVIFLISDGSFQMGGYPKSEQVPWKDVKEIVKGPLQGPEGCQLNFIGFEMKRADKSEMGSIVRSTKGKLREIK